MYFKKTENTHVKIFKFGGASVNSADAVRNVAEILRYSLKDELIVVISAMGKTTNALENVLKQSLAKANFDEAFNQLKTYHSDIMKSLFPETAHPIYTTIEALFEQLKSLALSPKDAYDYMYDQIVSYGELLATHIVSAYLQEQGITNVWADARQLIVADDSFRSGQVDWETTASRIQQMVNTNMPKSKMIITQGFIAGNSKGETVTLGREGSDYSAAIFAYCLSAESLTIWKDVPGFLNADPKYFKNTTKLDFISYNEAIELAYYGASIIHPKTIKPLQNKNIPLYVKSFLDIHATGSTIGPVRKGTHVPCYIFKQNQCLLSIYPKDFSFIGEENLSQIFAVFAKYHIRMNLMQNSAISFSVCIDGDHPHITALIHDLQADFLVKYNENLELITIRRYTPEILTEITGKKKVLLEQKSRITAQLILQ